MQYIVLYFLQIFDKTLFFIVLCFVIFRFKQFAISHASSSMKVGTDAVLLGAWANLKKSKNILDVGTGCGIIALMAAQQNSKAHIIGIDIHEPSVKEAYKNFENSRWGNRLQAIEISFQKFFQPNHFKFDHLLSNPPFFENSTPAPTTARHLARHNDLLSVRDFFMAAQQTLSPTGLISIIIPYKNSEVWIKTAEQFCFFPSRITHVISYANKPIERILCEFSSKKNEILLNKIEIRKGKGLGYSDEYIELTKEFYL